MGGIRGNYCQFCDRRIADCSCFAGVGAAPVPASTERVNDDEISHSMLLAGTLNHCESDEDEVRRIYRAMRVAYFMESTPVAARELDVEAEFRKWKGYELPALNNHGQFHQDWLHREFVAFKAGIDRAARRAAQSTAPVSTEQAGDAWISVEDRLPDESLLRFLVTGRAESGGSLGVHMATLYEGDMYFEGAAESGGCNPCINSVVTHWMPLPAAPSPNNSPVGGKD